MAGLRVPDDIIVSNDGSTDNTSELASRHGAQVVSIDEPEGPAAARNRGAGETDADLLFFLDADVLVHTDTVLRIIERFETDTSLTAVFGSYDDTPLAPGVVSQYRNLLHHYVHHTSTEDTQSFWAGCGAIRRTTFVAAGGFDPAFRRPSIEDIELGYRLSKLGHRVKLDPRIQVTHLKRWRFRSMVVTDIRDRAYPWSRLLLTTHWRPSELNLQWSHRVSSCVVWLGLASVVWGTSRGSLLTVSGALLGSALALLWLNRAFYVFLWRKKGFGFTLAAVGMHALYYAYSSATLGVCWLAYQVQRIAAPKAESRGGRLSGAPE